MLPYAREHDVGVYAYGPLAHGLLANSRFDPARDFGPQDMRRNHRFFAPALLERTERVLGQLDEFARARGHTIAQLAIAWVLAQPGVHTAIVGTGKPAHIASAAAAAEIELSPEDLDAIDQILRGAPELPVEDT